MSKPQGTLRDLMPGTADIVDWLRQQLGKEIADKIVLGGKLGKGTFRSTEKGPDGVVRTFGSFHEGTKWPVPEAATNNRTEAPARQYVRGQGWRATR